jgi:hypothetical protein
MSKSLMRVSKLALKLGDTHGLDSCRLLGQGKLIEGVCMLEHCVCETIFQLCNVWVNGVVQLFRNLVGSGADGDGVAQCALAQP